MSSLLNRLLRLLVGSPARGGGEPISAVFALPPDRSEALRDLLARMRGGAGGAPPPAEDPAEPVATDAEDTAADEGPAPLTFHLAVDDGGEFFVVAGRGAVLGHARAGVADVPLLADLEARHARLLLVESFHRGPSWRVEPLAGAPLTVNGRTHSASVPLVDGDLVEAGANVSFRFRRPDPASASALLEFQHGVEVEGAQTVLLFVPGAGGRVRIGQRRARHVAVTGIEHEIELSVTDQELHLACAGGLRVVGADAPAPRPALEVRLPVPPAARVDVLLGARPAHPAPYGLSLFPSDPPTMPGPI